MSDPQEQLFLEYDKRRVRRRLLGIAWFIFIVAGGLGFGATGLEGTGRYVVMGTWMLVGVALVWASWRNWRCPACDGALDRDEPRHCPHCGARLVP